MKTKLNNLLFLSSLSLCMFFLSVQNCFAIITIHSITTSVSTCGNNGTATVLATSNKPDPFLIYELISGPATAPIQNNATFSSLFPGTYTVRVYDIDFASQDRSFTISGNYQLPSLHPNAINPICSGFMDGKIIGNPTTSSGKAPFSWQIIAPYTSPPQSSDVFNNLSSGSYTIRMTDACGNFQTRTVILVDGSTGLSNWSDGVPSILKIGCDTVVLSQYIVLFKEKAKIPLTLTMHTTAGTKIKHMLPIPIDTTNFTPGLFQVVDTLSGISYNDYLYLCVSDTCGKSICAPKYTVSPFQFYLEYKVGNDCGNKMSADIRLYNPPYYPAYMYTTYAKPATMTLTDLTTNTVVDSLTITNDYETLQTQEQLSGRNYRLKIVDGCGEIFQQTILWPVPAAPRVETYTGTGCMDSTAAGYFNIWNFKSNVTLEILSGPPKVQSTKAHYAFEDTITYPKIFNATRNGFALKNLAAGNYQYRVSDTCGNSINGTLNVQEVTLANFNYSYSIKKGCLGDNILYFDASSQNTAAVYVRDLPTNSLLYHRRGNVVPDSLTSLPPGDYLIEIYYGYYYVGGQFYDASMTDAVDCWSVFDTITIPPYSNNTFKSSNTVFCNGTSYLQLNVDSSRGVPPYQYEITGGPQVFPLQSSNLFNIPTYGDYVIRIQDACGNSNIRQISIDSAKFPPVIKKGASCMGSKITLAGISSPYFKYVWKKPNGSFFTGDSLVINPLSIADTGLYIISKIVTINGCSDTFQSSYQVYMNDVTKQTIPFCRGTTILVGTHLYNAPGVYRDTLTNALGCDSIVITSLLPVYKKDSLIRTICPGQTISVGIHSYYQTGIYRDTLINISGCDSIVVLNLTVSPYKRSTLFRSICPGQTFTIGSNTYHLAGVYSDTLTTTLCDSIVTLHLSLAPLPNVTLGNDTSICQGQSLLLHTNNTYPVYFWNNIFSDSLQSTFSVHTTGKFWLTVKNSFGCTATDTIQVVNLYPLPIVATEADKSICSGTHTTLSASGGSQYKWYPTGEELSTITVQPTITTVYSVIAFDAHQCGSIPAQVKVEVKPAPTAPAFENNTLLHCFDEGPAQLQTLWGESFLWNPTGDTTQSIDVQQSGSYSVTIYDTNDCFLIGEIVVVEYCPPLLFLPNAFSPNGDFLHDDLEIFGKHFKNFELKIFNRWGEIIFISHDRNHRWDGNYRGQEMPIGTYPWIISYQGEYDETEEKNILKGSITIVR